MNHNHFFLYNNTKVGSMKGRFKKKKKFFQRVVNKNKLASNEQGSLPT